MHPEFLFSFFGSPYTVRAYDVFSIIAILSAVILAPPLLLRKAGMKTRKGLAFTLVLLAVFITGARLFNYAVNPMQYGGLLQIWSWRFTGFSLYGGLIASGLALPVLSFLFRCRLWAAADALVLPAGTAFSLIRLGCFLNGCCAGTATDSVLGVAVPVTEKETELLGKLLQLVNSPVMVKVWPTQIFESGLAILGLAVILPLSRRRRLSEGSAALMYAMWFTAARWGVLPLRSLPYRHFVTDIFYPALYGSIILACGLMLYWRNKKREECGLIK